MKACIRCAHLADCKEASDHRNELEQYCCSTWTKAEEYELEARAVLVQSFGPAALRFVANQNPAPPRYRRRSP